MEFEGKPIPMDQYAEFLKAENDRLATELNEARELLQPFANSAGQYGSPSRLWVRENRGHYNNLVSLRRGINNFDMLHTSDLEAARDFLERTKPEGA